MSPSEGPAIQVVGAAILATSHSSPSGGTSACLVAQRGPGAASEALKWEFPGGKVEPGEAPRSALEREIREELAVEIIVGAWLGRGQRGAAGGRGAIELDVYAARIVAGEVLLAEHCRYGWFRGSEIDALDWAAADRPVLPALKRLLSE